MEIGRVYVKTSGRESGKSCVIVDTLDHKLVLIDGNVKRRKCNPRHLEPTSKVLELKKGASTSEVKDAMKAAGLLAEARLPSVTKKRERKAGEKPKRGTKPKAEAKKGKEKKPAKKKTEEEIVEESLAKV